MTLRPEELARRLPLFIGYSLNATGQDDTIQRCAMLNLNQIGRKLAAHVGRLFDQDAGRTGRASVNLPLNNQRFSKR